MTSPKDAAHSAIRWSHHAFSRRPFQAMFVPCDLFRHACAPRPCRPREIHAKATHRAKTSRQLAEQVPIWPRPTCAWRCLASLALPSSSVVLPHLASAHLPLLAAHLISSSSACISINIPRRACGASIFIYAPRIKQRAQHRTEWPTEALRGGWGCFKIIIMWVWCVLDESARERERERETKVPSLR